MRVDFPGVTTTVHEDALVLYSQQSLQMLSSALVGGGFIRACYILNRHVRKGYCHADPAQDLRTFARGRDIAGPFVGLMTAASMQRAQSTTRRHRALTVAAVVTAGLSNAATPGLTPPAPPRPGTINLILLMDARLTRAAMVNAVITATEVKTQVVLTRRAQTPEGHAATGTSTDAMVVACTGRGEALSYAGPVTVVGWLIGQCVRTALERALHEAS